MMRKSWVSTLIFTIQIAKSHIDDLCNIEQNQIVRYPPIGNSKFSRICEAKDKKAFVFEKRSMT